jgi:hypothetical protein
MADTEPDDDTESLTKSKTKKERTPAQIAAFEKMKAAAAAKLGNKAIDPHKKAVLAMVKEKLNGPPKGAAPPPDSDSEEEVVSAVEEVEVPPAKKVKAPKVVEEVVKPPKKSKATPLPVEEDSSSEEEVIVVKKKKKPKKKTIIYEESSSDEEPAPPKKEVRETRDTKTQQNKASRFKVSLPETKPSGPVYYFAD